MGKMDKTEKYTVAGLCFGGRGVFLPPSRRARAPQGRTGEPGMVTPWGTREGALWHVSHIDRYQSILMVLWFDVMTPR